MTDASTQQQAPAPRPFAAAHEGLCAVCEEPFTQGDLITRAHGGWSHAQCPEEKPMGEVCADCFTLKPLNGRCLC